MLPVLEDGIAGAHDDGRVTALNQLCREYSEALTDELGHDFDFIDARIDALATRLEEQGSWDDWGNNIRGLKAVLRERAT
jgi:hypothetical protein